MFTDGGIPNVVIGNPTITRKLRRKTIIGKPYYTKKNSKTFRLNFRPIENQTAYDFPKPQQK
jgi:hypothetical protein